MFILSVLVLVKNALPTLTAHYEMKKIIHLDFVRSCKLIL